MKFSPLLPILLLANSLHAQEENPDAAQLMREVRYSQAEDSFDVTGELTKGRKTVPFRMSMIEELDMIRFYFKNPTQTISLVLKDNRYELVEQVVGQEPKELPQERYGETIRGTDLTYEDISQRFLYWPDPKIVDDEKERVQFLAKREAWVVRLDNPRPGLGPYRVVKVWIDKESKAILRVDGFDMDGRKIKSFEVTNVQKDKDVGIWVLDKMRVETIDPDGNRKEGTVLSMNKPTRRK